MIRKLKFNSITIPTCVLILLSSLNSNSPSLTGDTISIPNDPAYSAAYIVNNLDYFCASYNEALLEDYSNKITDDDEYNPDYEEESEEEYEDIEVPEPDYLTASSVEKIVPIYIITTDIEADDSEVGYFIDFGEDTGYLTVGYNYEIYGLEAIGESPYKDMSDDTACVYIKGSGYFYAEGDGTLRSADENRDTLEDDIDNIYVGNYVGQESGTSGCGRIYNTMLYTRFKYGYNYHLDSWNSLDMKSFKMYQLSVYKTLNPSGVYSYENNCWIMSAYHVLQYLADNTFSNMPKNNEREIYDPQVDESVIYSNYFDADGNSKKKITMNNTSVDKYELCASNYFSFPALYNQTRRIVNDNFGRCDGGTARDTANILKYTGDYYGNPISCSIHSYWSSYLNSGINQLNNDKPLIWTTYGGTYGNHSMAVSGYKKYTKQISFLFFSFTKEKIYYGIKDAKKEIVQGKKSYSKVYYDMSGYKYFGALTSFNY